MTHRFTHDTPRQKLPVERRKTQEQIQERQRQAYDIGLTAAMLAFMESYDADGDDTSRGGMC